MRIPGVYRILDTMSWMRECIKLQEGLEWLKAHAAGIEYGRACEGC